MKLKIRRCEEPLQNAKVAANLKNVSAGDVTVAGDPTERGVLRLTDYVGALMVSAISFPAVCPNHPRKDTCYGLQIGAEETPPMQATGPGWSQGRKSSDDHD
ncbi:hypothetical protein NDU88_008815 [Pleurodeles waltl]|uniref:Uncharacterized protein n=1 Tax=Pleurodeles waltl TaxID=8319 RepID=A0AAV7QPS2_PLEWA|nr:hypothetical protein NDU88_008815 [Pleurodeles waltl]